MQQKKVSPRFLPNLPYSAVVSDLAIYQALPHWRLGE